MQLIASGLRFPEGPVSCSDGTLLVVEMEGEAIARIEPRSGSVTRIARCAGGPNGLAIGAEGLALVCNNGGSRWRDRSGLRIPGQASAAYDGGSIDRLELATGTVTRWLTSVDGHALSAPNDIVFDADGGCYFTDTGKDLGPHRVHGAVYYLSADGRCQRRLVYPLVTPNGIGLSPDGRELYVAETQTARLWAWPVLGPGVLGRAGGGPRGARLVHGFGGHQLLDSLAIDSEGNIVVATLIFGGLSVVAAAGGLRRQLRLPGDDPLVTNICFGGPDLRTAYVCSSGRGAVYALEWPCPGLALPFAC